jgi:hypothetical protein|tara:strand:+ start:18224 stop:18721 length:498 start_codon:yes stop_codon:yes gene_type:complete
MKLILRILLAIHFGLILFGIYCAIFDEEYILSSKYIFIGFTGVLVFLNTLLLFPIKVKFQNILLGIGILLYIVSASGFIFPIIFKNYWGILFGFAIFLFLMSLFTYSGKTLFESKIDYLFLVGASFTALPFIIQIKQNSIVLIGGAILLLLSGVIIARIFRNQSK